MSTSPQDTANRKPLDVGARLHLVHFGAAQVRKIYEHPDSKEPVADVVTHAGKAMHLSLRYCEARRAT